MVACPMVTAHISSSIPLGFQYSPPPIQLKVLCHVQFHSNDPTSPMKYPTSFLSLQLATSSLNAMTAPIDYTAVACQPS